MPDIFVSEPKKQEPVEKTSDTIVKMPTADKSINQGDGGTVHLFTSYCEEPDDITFENQEEDEKVLLFIRKDFVTNLPWIISGAFLIMIPLIAIILLSFFNIKIPPLPQNYVFSLITFYYLLISIFIFINFITWYFNLDIVTEKRVLDIEFMGIAYKNVAATKLTLVQDVSYTQVGVIRTLFDYGDVLVQTAGTIDNFTFEAVPRPEDAVHVVENLIGKRNEQL